MSYTVYVDYGSGWVSLTDYSGENLVRYKGFEKVEQLHDDDYKNSRNSVKLQLTSDITLVNNLINATGDIAWEIYNNGSYWFRGYSRPVTEFKASTADNVIDIEIYDATHLLAKAIDSDITYEGLDLCDSSNFSNSIIHQLLSAAGYNINDTAEVNITIDIAQTIPIITFEEGTSFEDAINGILWDYHHVLNATDAGVLYVYNWAPVNAPSITKTFDESNTVKSIELSRDDKDYDRVQVEYHELIERNNITLVKKSYTDTPENTLLKILTTSALYEWGGSVEYASVEDDATDFTWPSSGGRFKFENPVEDSEFLTANVDSVSWYAFELWNSVFFNVGSGSKNVSNYVSLASSSYSNTYADLQFLIPAPGLLWFSTYAVRGLKSVTITGDLKLLKKHTNKTAIIPAAGNDVKVFKANYIYDSGIAVDLATAISNNLEYGKWEYKWASTEEADIGDYVQIVNTTTLNVDTKIRIQKKSWNEKRKTFEYTGRGVTDLGTPVGSVISGTYTILSEGELAEAVGRVDEALDGTGNIKRVIDSNVLNTESEQSIRGVSGLYFTAEYLGFYNGDQAVDDWTARIQNDGTFKFLGDSDNFIEWDGAALNIQGDAQSANFVSGSAGWQLNNAGDAEFNNVTVRGTIESTLGSIGGWDIGSTTIESADDTVFLRSNSKRLEIQAGNNIKIALGYLSGIGSYTSSNYGLYIADGSEMALAGGGTITENDINVQSDGALVMKGGESNESELLRIGSLGNGDVGIDIGGMKFESTLYAGGDATDTVDTLVGGGSAAITATTLIGGGNSLYGANGLLYEMSSARLIMDGDAIIDGTVTADKIAAGTITADKINITDIFTMTIQSNNFVSGSSGWEIDSNGDVEFNNGVFRGSLEAASGSFFSTDGTNGVEIKDGAVIFTDSNVFGGTSKGSLQQGSLGNIGITGDLAALLKTSNGHSVQVNAFGQFVSSSSVSLGEDTVPWDKGYIKSLYVQEELKLGNPGGGGMSQYFGGSFLGGAHTQNEVYDAIHSVNDLGNEFGCFGFIRESNGVTWYPVYGSVINATPNYVSIMCRKYNGSNWLTSNFVFSDGYGTDIYSSPGINYMNIIMAPDF